MERTDNGFSIAAENTVFPMRAATNSELPEWLEEDYQAAVDLMDAQDMDAQEEAEQTLKNQGEQGVVGIPTTRSEPDFHRD